MLANFFCSCLVKKGSYPRTMRMRQKLISSEAFEQSHAQASTNCPKPEFIRVKLPENFRVKIKLPETEVKDLQVVLVTCPATFMMYLRR